MYNDDILNEYHSVLTRPKFGFPETIIDETLEVIKRYGINSSRKESDEELPDPKDIVFYEVALSKEDSYLVTGNTKHFPKKPFVVTPAEMLQIIHEMKSPKNGILSEPSIRYGNQ
jgi:predicted nucleic acid-binding protein